MNPQILVDDKGNETGVFIPMAEWNRIKEQYPEISGEELNDRQKMILDQRLSDLENHSEKFRPIEGLFESISRK
ncbi:hypothetical protein [Jiulongibacter sediminis]|uniref:Addiction module component CHP02574 family protein n=1 Tax=Jiulongibacter sediminis TaxID=1605367 RepID=A0A0N8H9U7_9BACT|nr:hypothetical protein [Jiulongibacter sediminis]KPM48364.1 hypothetical protein AFM12_06880 [Jiulongibacter sediminis]TBX24901.1 hypothetical protein TK44_06885 [Jiulongibacter sediminis]